MPPTYSLTGARNARVNGQLDAWAIQQGDGLAFDSSTGFVLPNGARRSPDACWVQKSRIRALDPVSREKFFHLCPDFVIDPVAHTVEIYRPGREPEVLGQPDRVTGEDPVAGLVLELKQVWDPLG